MVVTRLLPDRRALSSKIVSLVVRQGATRSCLPSEIVCKYLAVIDPPLVWGETGIDTGTFSQRQRRWLCGTQSAIPQITWFSERRPTVAVSLRTLFTIDEKNRNYNTTLNPTRVKYHYRRTNEEVYIAGLSIHSLPTHGDSGYSMIFKSELQILTIRS